MNKLVVVHLTLRLSWHVRAGVLIIIIMMMMMMMMTMLLLSVIMAHICLLSENVLIMCCTQCFHKEFPVSKSNIYMVYLAHQFHFADNTHRKTSFSFFFSYQSRLTEGNCTCIIKYRSIYSFSWVF
jgi:hypothetical protein